MRLLPAGCRKGVDRWLGYFQIQPCKYLGIVLGFVSRNFDFSMSIGENIAFSVREKIDEEKAGKRRHRTIGRGISEDGHGGRGNSRRTAKTKRRIL